MCPVNHSDKKFEDMSYFQGKNGFIFIRKVYQELLFAKNSHTNTKRDSIFNTLFRDDMKNVLIVSVAKDRI